MSVKHVIRYYKQVSQQYFDLIDELKDLEKEANENLVSPEQVEQMKQMVEPIKTNYMTLSWIMHLLKQPNKKSKIANYKRKTKQFTESLDVNRSKDGILKENQDILATVKDSFKT